MTGLDQDLMQKNLSMGTIKEAQKNMITFTSVFVVINIFFWLLERCYISMQRKMVLI